MFNSWGIGEMGKNFRVIIFLTLMTTILAGCSSNKEILKNKEIKIGVSLYKQEDNFILSMRKNIEEIAKEKEISEKIKINLEILDAKGNSTNQGNQVDKFIKQDYDIICVNLVDRTAAATIIDKAKSANIPIIFFNREPVEEDMNRWDKVFYVGAQAEQSARIQADIIIDEWEKNRDIVDKNKDGKIQYVMLEGEPGHQDASIRTEYCIKAMYEKGIELEKLADDSANWQSDQAVNKMNQWINDFGDKIEVVFSNNDAMALGAIISINNNIDKFSSKPIVVGIDGIEEALEAVKSGELKGTVISDAKLQAKSIFDIAYALSNDKTLDNIEGLEKGKYVKTAHKKVTKENLEEYLNSINN